MTTKANQDSAERWAVKALVIACMTIAAAALLVIVEKSPIGMVVLLTVFVAAMVYPIVEFVKWKNPTQSPREKAFLNFVLIVVTVLAACVLGDIFWPSPRIRVVSVGPAQPTPNQPQTANLYIRNDGRDARIQFVFRLFYVDRNFRDERDRDEMEEHLWEQFQAKPGLMPEQDILNGETTWLTMGHDDTQPNLDLVLSGDQVTRLLHPTGPCVYMMGQFRYVDLISERTLDFCEYFQSNIAVIPRCVHHNGVAKWP